MSEVYRSINGVPQVATRTDDYIARNVKTGELSRYSDYLSYDQDYGWVGDDAMHAWGREDQAELSQEASLHIVEPSAPQLVDIVVGQDEVIIAWIKGDVHYEEDYSNVD